MSFHCYGTPQDRGIIRFFSKLPARDWKADNDGENGENGENGNIDSSLVQDDLSWNWNNRDHECCCRLRQCVTRNGGSVYMRHSGAEHHIMFQRTMVRRLAVMLCCQRISPKLVLPLYSSDVPLLIRWIITQV